MRVEAAVFDGDDGVEERVGHLVDRHIVLALVHALSDRIAQKDEAASFLHLRHGVEERGTKDCRTARDEEGETENGEEKEGKAQEPLDFLHDGKSVLL